MVTGIWIGIFSFRKENNLYIHALFNDHIDPSERRFDPGRITIIKNGDVFRVSLDHANLILRQGCPRGGDYIFDSSLIYGDHIGITFHQKAGIFGGDGVTCKENPVKRLTLIVDIRIGRVDILGPVFFGGQDSATEPDYTAWSSMDRKDNPGVEPIVCTVVFLQRQPAFDQVVKLVSIV